MDVLYQVVMLVLIGVLPLLLMGIAKPGMFPGALGIRATHKQLALCSAVFVAGIFGLTVHVQPYAIEQARQADEQRRGQLQAARDLEQAERRPGQVPSAVAGTDTERTPTDESYALVAVQDGDTAQLQHAGATATVRLLGVDAPELGAAGGLGCHAQKAGGYLQGLLAGQQIRLERDSGQPNADAEGRLLRYVFVNGTHINELMISTGHAYEQTYETLHRYQQQFKQAQLEAKRKQAGVWSSTECAGSQRAAEDKPAHHTPPPVLPPQNSSEHGPVKKSPAGICLQPDSASYSVTSEFEAFDSLRDCLADGGRLPL